MAKKPTNAKLDLSAVWARGIVLLRENFGLIAVLAGVFVLLPNALLQFTLPPDSELEGPFNVMLDMSASEANRTLAAQALAELLAPFMGSAFAVIIISHVAYGATAAFIGPDRPTIGEAIGEAMKAILPLTAAIVIYFVLLYLIFLVLQILTAFLGVAGAIIALFGGTFLALYLTARLALTLPAIVIEKVYNPAKALLRSWSLTSGRGAGVFAFWSTLAVTWLVTLIIQSLVSMLLAGIAGPGSTASLIEGLLSGLFSAFWGSIYCVMGVAMFLRLTGAEAGSPKPLPDTDTE